MVETDNKAKGFFIFFNDVSLLDRLTAEETGNLFKALNVYAMCGKATSFEDRYLNFVFNAFRKHIDSYYKARNLVAPFSPSEPEIDVTVQQTTAPKITERPVAMPQLVLDSPTRDIEKIDPDLSFSKEEFINLKAYAKAN